MPFATVNTVSTQRIRREANNKSAPIPAQQRQKKLEARKDKQEAIDDAVGEWYSYTIAKADDLAQRFNKKPRYFLDIFFQGGARMVNHQSKVNPYNAFKSLKAQELSDNGERTKLVNLQEAHREEYEALTNVERAELVDEFTAKRDERTKIQRPTPKARVMDVANVVRNIRLLMTGLNQCVGTEGFFCIVRNTPEYHMSPQWYFSSRELEQYMQVAVRKKWDTSEVGARLEAFAVAGCNVTNDFESDMLRTSKQKAAHLKSSIREKISEMLVEITGNSKAIMNYVNYEEAIVQRYGVLLEGWTFPKFVNPSELSTGLPPLQTLLDALNNGSCKFVKLSREERKARETCHRQKLASGEIQVHERKTRKDAGKKRKRSSKIVASDCGSGTEMGDEAASHKKHKSAPTVDTESDDDSDG